MHYPDGSRLINICVLTYHRPGPLSNLLPLLCDEAVAHAATRPSDRVQIVVIDNDPDGSAQKVVACAAATRGEVPFNYVSEPRPGISAARNKALAESVDADLVAFIDDDETPDTGWLGTLVRTLDQYEADAVSGPVVSIFDIEPEPWITLGGFFDRAYAQGRPDGLIIHRAATNNLLLDMATVRRTGVHFDDAFGLTGGEDSLFTGQLLQRGGTIRWSRHALVFDHVPVHRLTRKYVLERAFNTSNCSTRVDLALAGSQSARALLRAVTYSRSMAKLVLGQSRKAVGAAFGSARDAGRAQRAIAQSRGALAALWGRHTSPYGMNSIDHPAGQIVAASRIMVAHPSSDLYGADLQLAETVRGLVESGHDVTVIIPGDGPLTSVLQSAGADVSFVEVPVLRKAALTSTRLPSLMWSIVESAWRLRALLRSQRPNALIVNTVTIPSWLVAARLAKIPTLCHVHEAETSQSFIVRFGLTLPLLLARRVVTNSKASTGAITATIPLLSRRTRLVYNGVAAPQGPIAFRTATPDDNVQLALIGRLSPRKGTDVALEALALLRADGLDATLVICGSAFQGYEWFEEQLRKRACREDLRGHVTFRGYVALPQQVLAESDFVLVPSRVEPFGNVAVEALLSCRPLIASATQGLQEIVVDRENGLLVRPGDPRSLADAVILLVRNPEFSRGLARKGQADAISRFSVKRYRQELTRYVDEVAAMALSR